MIIAVVFVVLSSSCEMKITVVSGMARNRGESRKVEVEPELLTCDLIKRVCVLMNIQSEPRMYLRLPDSSEVGGEDVLGSFVRCEATERPHILPRAGPDSRISPLFTLLSLQLDY